LLRERLGLPDDLLQQIRQGPGRFPRDSP
jgi:hypothetical protein